MFVFSHTCFKGAPFFSCTHEHLRIYPAASGESDIGCTGKAASSSAHGGPQQPAAFQPMQPQQPAGPPPVHLMVQPPQAQAPPPKMEAHQPAAPPPVRPSQAPQAVLPPLNKFAGPPVQLNPRAPAEPMQRGSIREEPVVAAKPPWKGTPTVPVKKAPVKSSAWLKLKLDPIILPVCHLKQKFCWL